MFGHVGPTKFGAAYRLLLFLGVLVLTSSQKCVRLLAAQTFSASDVYLFAYTQHIIVIIPEMKEAKNNVVSDNGLAMLSGSNFDLFTNLPNLSRYQRFYVWASIITRSEQ